MQSNSLDSFIFPWVILWARLVGGILLLISALSCTSLKPNLKSISNSPQQILNQDPPKNWSDEIQKTTALYRASMIRDLLYQLDLDVTERDRFKGRIQIDFELIAPARDLTLDFLEGEVLSLTVNGVPIGARHHRSQILIPASALKPRGPQTVQIEFTGNYRTDGQGLHQFIEPKTQDTYLFTQFEPAMARALFPCFDQPDLKAAFILKVKAPTGWKVISAQRESQVEKLSSQVQLWTFPATPKMSTYVFSLHAGPFTQWEDSRFRYPLRLFARRSLAHQIQPEDWFSVTRKGFDFFESYFGINYPFKKYDQLIVPEAPFGAMENTAAVTFNEKMAPAGKRTAQQVFSLNNIILHELAHMWFGNLVTLDWWDDLWLNESFATLMSHIAQSNLFHPSYVWSQFSALKASAYHLDSLSTTHPISIDIEDTLQAESNFDAITYQKGAAIIKQFLFLIGPNEFKSGIQTYFQRYAFKNASTSLFFRSFNLSESGVSDSWIQDWIHSSGLNTINMNWICEGSKLSQIIIHQKASSGEMRSRIHSGEISLIHLNADQEVKIFKLIPWKLNSPEMTFEIKEPTDCPQAIFANTNDHGYFRSELDSTSQQFFLKYFKKLPDNHLKTLILQSLWEDVLYGKLKASEHLKVLLDWMETESESFLYSRMQQQALYSLKILSSQSAPEILKLYLHYQQKLENILALRLSKAAPNSHQELDALIQYIENTRSQEAQNWKKNLLSSKKHPLQHRLDPDQRWRIILSICQTGDIDALNLAQKERDLDSGYRGVSNFQICEVSHPKLIFKQNFISSFLKKETPMSLFQAQKNLQNLFPVSQWSIRNQYGSQFFIDFKKVLKAYPPHVSLTFLNLAPFDCGPGVELSIKSQISDFPKLPSSLVRAIQELEDQEAECRSVIQKERMPSKN